MNPCPTEQGRKGNGSDIIQVERVAAALGKRLVTWPSPAATREAEAGRGRGAKIDGRTGRTGLYSNFDSHIVIAFPQMIQTLKC